MRKFEPGSPRAPAAASGALGRAAPTRACADAIVRVVGLPFGKRPFRTTIDRLRRIRLEDRLTPLGAPRA